MSGECGKCGGHVADCFCGKDKVNHPNHYMGEGIECIDVIQAFDLGFCLGNAIKYILRADRKDNRKEDIQKAIWYLKRDIGDM